MPGGTGSGGPVWLRFLRQQLVYERTEFALELGVLFAGGRAVEPGVNLAHAALAVDDKRRRERIHAV